jgi:hypothetical protein
MSLNDIKMLVLNAGITPTYELIFNKKNNYTAPIFTEQTKAQRIKNKKFKNK